MQRRPTHALPGVLFALAAFALAAGFFLAAPAAAAPLAGADGTWLRLPVPEVADAPMVYDPLRERFLVFGGYRDNEVLYDDMPVWEYTAPVEPGGQHIWRRLHLGGPAPTNRIDHAAVYDSLRDRVVVYGGLDAVTNLSVGDVWVLENLGGSPTWMQLSPTGGPPPTRYGSATVFDPPGDRLVTYGGYTDDASGGPLEDLWELSFSGGPVWSPLADFGDLPGIRIGPAHAYDPIHRRLVLHGGGTVGTTFLDLVTLEWTDPVTSGTPIDSELFATGVYDPYRQRILFTRWGPLDHFDLAALSMDAPYTWTTLTPLDWLGLEPIGRYTHAAAYDVANDRMLVLGGTAGAPTIFGDAWFYDPDYDGSEQWIPAAPAPREGAAVAYDPVRQRLWLFGGNGYGGPLADLWALDLNGGGQWICVQSMTPPPPPRAHHTFLYDEQNDVLVCFGGESDSVLSDVWALADLDNPDGPSWAPLAPLGAPPDLEVGHTAIFDPLRHRIVVFGRESGGVDNQVWALSLGLVPVWTQMHPTGVGPFEGEFAASVYDPVADAMIVYGGGDPPATQTFRLLLSGLGLWMPVVTTGTPPARFGHAMVYDSNRQRAVVFGGEASGVLNNGLYALDLSVSPSPWTELMPDCAPEFCEKPVARSRHAAVFDPAFDRLIVVAGSGSQLAGEAWLWNDTWALSFGTVVAADAAPTAAFVLAAPRPNPTRSGVRFDLTTPRAADAEIALYDAAGRLVRSVFRGPLEAGAHGFHWDGKGASGQTAAAGLYFLRARVGSDSQVRKVVVTP